MLAFLPSLSLPLAVTVAIPAPTPDRDAVDLAIMDASGRVRVGLESGAQPLDIHRCPIPDLEREPTVSEDLEAESQGMPTCADRPSIGAMAWLDDTLYLACSEQDGLFAWRPGMDRAEPVQSGLAARVSALARLGSDLVIADQRGDLSVHRPGRTPERLVRAPEPVVAMASSGQTIVVAGASALWTTGPRKPGDPISWRVLAPVHGCALSRARAQAAEHAFWVAGPDGLARIDGTSISWHRVASLTGVASGTDELWLADGSRIERMRLVPEAATGDPAAASLGPNPRPPRVEVIARGEDDPWRALRTRQRWASVLPRLRVQATLSRAEDRQMRLQFWLWMTWTTPAHEVLP